MSITMTPWNSFGGRGEICHVLNMKQLIRNDTNILVHYDDVIMTMLASQITSLTVVYSIVYSGAIQRKHQSSASLAFVREIHRGPVNNFPHKWPVTRKMFPFDDVIMWWYDRLPIRILRERLHANRIWYENTFKYCYQQCTTVITDSLNVFIICWTEIAFTRGFMLVVTITAFGVLSQYKRPGGLISQWLFETLCVVIKCTRQDTIPNKLYYL